MSQSRVVSNTEISLAQVPGRYITIIVYDLPICFWTTPADHRAQENALATALALVVLLHFES